MKYSHAPVHWKKFVDDLQAIYYSVRDAKNPKIKIENGTIQEDNKKVPIYEVKPMKKDKKKVLESSDSKNKLEVKQHPTKSKKKEEKESKTKIRDQKSREPKKDGDKPKSTSSKTTKKMEDEEKQQTVVATKVEEVNGLHHVIHEDKTGIGRFVTKYGKDLKRNVKPPVVLVFADSIIAKDSVKSVLHEILNRERWVLNSRFRIKSVSYWVCSNPLPYK